MTILAVYQDSQLQIPVKVLTHYEDIMPILSAAGISFKSLEQALPDRSMISVERAAEVSSELLALSGVEEEVGHFEVMQLQGPPGYAELSGEEAQSEQVLVGDSLWLFLDGAATLCLHHDGLLLVLGCRRGDLLGLPSGLAHWAVPVTARRCLLVRSASEPGALLSKPTGDDIAVRYPVLEL